MNNISNDIEKRILGARESGKYKIVGLDMFDRLTELEITDEIFDLIEYSSELLTEYLDDLEELKEDKLDLAYLHYIKNKDITNNQILENEDSNLILFQKELMDIRKTLVLQGMDINEELEQEIAVDKLIEYINKNKIITVEDFYDIHRILLNGTSSKGKSTIRQSNVIYVNKIENGKEDIDYFPIDYHDVYEATKRILDIYNQRLTGKCFNNVFIQPLIVHGLIGALQIFGDGNTRMGRLMQNTLMWQLINEQMKYQFELPPIYTTETYFRYRQQYRGLISKLAKENNSEAWNEWFRTNLNIINESTKMFDQRTYDFITYPKNFKKLTKSVFRR